MQRLSKTQLIDLLKEFKALDYLGKVELFDKKFGLIPYKFPDYDIEASWFSNELKCASLSAAFSQEGRDRQQLQKDIKVGLTTASFDIRPLTKKQRIAFNQYCISSMLAKKEILDKHVKAEYEKAVNKRKFVEAKIDQLSTIINWVQYAFKKHPENALRVKFLQIFYNGFLAYNKGNNSQIMIRRKFVELYLYSQGMLLAAHYQEIQSRLESMPRKNSLRDSLSLPLKIVLLHKLGIIRSLEEPFKKRHMAGYQNSLAELICLITSEDASNQDSIVKYLNALCTGSSADLLTPKNLRIVEEELEKLELL